MTDGSREGRGWVPASAGTTISSRERRLGGRPCGGREGRGRGMGSRPVSGYGAGFSRVNCFSIDEMDVPTPIDSRLNVDGRLSESPLPTYSRLNVDGRLSESPLRSESPLPTYDGVPVSSSLSRYFRRYDGGAEGDGEGDGFPPRIGVRGRLFAGTTISSRGGR